MIRIAIFLLFVTVALASPLSTSGLAPLIEAHHPHGTINNSFIVAFKDHVPLDLRQNHINFLEHIQSQDDGLSGIRHIYDGPFSGYAGSFTPSIIESIRASPEVAYVEKDQIMRTALFQTEKTPSWGLARVSHRAKLTFDTFTKYIYDDLAGEGVYAYIIDTGINTQHVDFQGRASWGAVIADSKYEDGVGHGTHCAGTIGSRTYGVAKKAKLIAVKVLGSDGSGSTSDVIAGIQWTVKDATAKAVAAAKEFAVKGTTNYKGAVVNMSLGGGKSTSLDSAVNRAVDAGLHFAVAAGNDNRDACNYSPAAAQKPITVGASTLADERASFSNWGKCVDVFGPGLNILSTWIGSTTATNTISGTSMATPHVVGLMAYFLSIYPSATFNPTSDELISLTSSEITQTPLSGIYAVVHASLPPWISVFLPAPEFAQFAVPMMPAQLKKSLLAIASPNKLTGLPANTPNLLVFNNATSVTAF